MNLMHSIRKDETVGDKNTRNRPINDSLMKQSDTPHHSSTNAKVRTESVKITEKQEFYTTAQSIDWQPLRRFTYI